MADMTSDAQSDTLFLRLQRKKRNCMEDARDIQQLVEKGNSITYIARRSGLSRSETSNRLRLLKLPDSVQSLLETGALQPTTARPLCVLPGDQAASLAERAVSEGWTSKGMEAFVRQQVSHSQR